MSGQPIYLILFWSYSGNSVFTQTTLEHFKCIFEVHNVSQWLNPDETDKEFVTCRAILCFKVGYDDFSSASPAHCRAVNSMPADGCGHCS